jgi:Tfp pilus assembly protein PilN
MKSSKEKIAFGIFQDGLNIKVAQLTMDVSGAIKIQKLEETILTYPLYKEQEEKPEEVQKKKDVLEDDLELPEISEFEESEEYEEIKKEDELSGKNDLQKLLLNFPLDLGKIALNANDSQVTYYQFDSKFSKGLLRQKGEKVFLSKDGIKKLEAQIFGKEELKDRKLKEKYDFVINPDKSILAFAHRGEFELLKAMQEINLLLTKKKYFYSLIDPNEIALMNLVRNNYQFADDEYVLLLYIGVDYKVGIVMKGKIHVKTFPIIITDSKPANMRRAIFSKVTLEQDLSHLHFTQNIILAGEYIKDEDVAYFVLKFSYRSKVTRMEFGKDMMPAEKDMSEFGLGSEVNSEKMAKFSIPIGLAWKTLEPQNPNFIKTNLIPPAILEKQKPFKIAWHGWLLMVLLFSFALVGTMQNLGLSQQVTYKKRAVANLEKELQDKGELAKKLDEIKVELEQMVKEMERVEELQGDRAHWDVVINHLAKTFQTNSTSWIVRMMTEGEVIRLRALSTNRKSIVRIAESLPNSKITQILKVTTGEFLVWEFELEFTFPSPDDLELTLSNDYSNSDLSVLKKKD